VGIVDCRTLVAYAKHWVSHLAETDKIGIGPGTLDLNGIKALSHVRAN
jgi:hypothetical protein